MELLMPHACLARVCVYAYLHIRACRFIFVDEAP